MKPQKDTTLVNRFVCGSLGQDHPVPNTANLLHCCVFCEGTLFGVDAQGNHKENNPFQRLPRCPGIRPPYQLSSSSFCFRVAKWGARLKGEFLVCSKCNLNELKPLHT